tara:strand:+ start:746 stop:1105 length:360 start_codon:yes stop_codon:yes gene_type:complete
MRNDKIRRFRPRTNKYRSRRPNNGVQSNGIVHHVHNPRNGLSRNSINKNPHNLERIIEKYKNLAKEALSSGDKILHENYLQHSDHFSRILSEVVLEKSKNNSNQDTKNTQEKNTNIASE